MPESFGNLFPSNGYYDEDDYWKIVETERKYEKRGGIDVGYGGCLPMNGVDNSEIEDRPKTEEQDEDGL